VVGVGAVVVWGEMWRRMVGGYLGRRFVEGSGVVGGWREWWRCERGICRRIIDFFRLAEMASSKHLHASQVLSTVC